MPFRIFKDDGGFKVGKADGSRFFSNKPLTKKKAEAQMKAIYTSESARNSRDDKYKLKSGMDKELFLDIIKHISKKYDYDDSLLSLANDGKHKLIYDGIKFGSLSNMDFIQYLYNNIDSENYEDAFKHRERYLKRAYNIKGDWKDDEKSPNWLAIRLLWLG